MSLQQEIDNATLGGIRNDLMAVKHKLRHPMADILAKVPGETQAERARKIGVARQTMYVWAQEWFRPSGEQAAIISKLTGVPVEQICNYRGEAIDGAGRTARKKIASVAKAGPPVPVRPKRLRRTVRRVVLEQRERRNARKMRRRTDQRPNDGAGA